MTRAEAIQHFKEQLDIFGGEHAEAIKVAIEALQNKSRPFGDCSKCIHTYGTLGCCTTVSNEWVYDCEHGMEQYKSTKAEPSDDLISRADAIRVVEKNSYRMAGLTEVKLKCEIEAVPSADRPRGKWIETAQDYYETVNKKGGGVNENTEYFTDDIACPNCLAKFSNIDNETERFNFCPNCGADMRGDTK